MKRMMITLFAIGMVAMSSTSMAMSTSRVRKETRFLTDKMAMSRASLYNKVKLLTGLGVNDYINKLRIEKSVYLLTNTNMNINEISYEVGFSYPRYFSTSFKQVKGMTPTRFKEENKRN
jgi:AraC-like DNA-binding protein